MSTQPQGRTPPGRRATLIVSALAVLFVVVPALFWHGTWFGRSLTDEEIGKYLADKENPRQAQHALAQISERITQGDPAVKQWYPQIIALAGHPMSQLRLTTAWVMGQDADCLAFRQKLLNMLDDPDPLVQRNVALSLIRFGDASGRPILLAMLGPHTVQSGYAGVLANRLEAGDVVDQGTLLARVAVEGQEEAAEIRSPLPGVVKERLREDGATVQVGDEVMLLGPGAEHAFEALRALYMIGAPEDLEHVRPFLRPRENMPQEVARQARLTVEEIRRRAGL